MHLPSAYAELGSMWADEAMTDNTPAETFQSLDREAMLTEERYLRLFATDFYASMLIDDPATRDAALGGFYGRLRSRPDWPTLEAGLQKRLPVYTAAVKKNHELGIGYSVGKAFASFVNGGDGADPMAMMLGTSTFGFAGKLIKDTLDKLASHAASTRGGCASIFVLGAFLAAGWWML